MTTARPSVDLTHRPRLASLTRIGGPDGLAADDTVDVEASATRRPRISPPERFERRRGYNEVFLAGFNVPLPAPMGRAAADVLAIETSADGRLDYQHFSVVMSKRRRMAMFVGVNIDGKRSKKINRDSDVWFLDGRIPAEAQIGEDLYADNLLDRGHLVRREDPNWGTVEDARTANDDTFHFTNCSPQMGAFNQRTWLSLENYILQNARVWKDRVTVFTGPVFRADDLKYRDVLIPRAYWKVIAFLSEDMKPSATAYMVDQERELNDLEAAFGAFKTFQLSVSSIQKATGLNFGALVDFDGFSNEEAATRTEIAAELSSAGDIRV